jgi:hypothetical protein
LVNFRLLHARTIVRGQQALFVVGIH